jgi:micrococcal nuclease
MNSKNIKKPLYLLVALLLVVFGYDSLADNVLSENFNIGNQSANQSTKQTNYDDKNTSGSKTDTSNARVLDESFVQNTLTQLQTGQYLVTRIVDGDTVEVRNAEGEWKVRYIGIDAPETVHPTKKVGCYGLNAKLKNEELVFGKVVYMEKDKSETDRYGRLLRYVYVVNDGSGRAKIENDVNGQEAVATSVGVQDQDADEIVFVNLELVKGGYARAKAYKPDIAKQKMFESVEKEAEGGSVGLWGGC